MMGVGSGLDWPLAFIATLCSTETRVNGYANAFEIEMLMYPMITNKVKYLPSMSPIRTAETKLFTFSISYDKIGVKSLPQP